MFESALYYANSYYGYQGMIEELEQELSSEILLQILEMVGDYYAEN